MYVVRRPFRNYNQVIVPGSIVEPDTIKRFKSRLNDRYIIEVSEQNFDKWNEYFKIRFGVSIEVSEPVKQLPTQDLKDAVQDTKEVVQDIKETVTKPVVKVVAKATQK